MMDEGLGRMVATVLVLGALAALGLVAVAAGGRDVMGGGGSGFFRASTLKANTETVETLYTNSDTYNFTFIDTSGTPRSVFSSKDGAIVIASDKVGNIYRSVDYGSSWTSGQYLKVGSKGGYGSIYGLAMTSSGECMIAGTGLHATFKSTDYGASWSKLSNQVCSVITGTTDLKKLACIGGLTTDESVYLYYSHDSGVTWSKSKTDPGHWIGIVSNSDFTMVSASKYSLDYYFHNSSDGAVSFDSIASTESNDLEWGCLAGSIDLSTMIITDVKTRNVHVSRDYGNNWYRAFNAQTSKLQDSVTINACAVSKEGNAYALGFSGYQTLTVFNCPDPTEYKECNHLWVSQYNASSTGVFDTQSISLSQDGARFFSVDATNKQITVGVIEEDDDA